MIAGRSLIRARVKLSTTVVPFGSLSAKYIPSFQYKVDSVFVVMVDNGEGLDAMSTYDDR